MHDPELEKEELAASGSLIAKRLRSLARAAERRAAPADFRDALGRAVGALETGVDNLFGDLSSRDGAQEDRPAPALPAPDVVSPTAEDAPERMEFENAPLTGSCDIVPIADLIDWLGTLGKTGVLVVQSEVERFTVEFKRGRVVHACSDQAPAGGRLGDIIVQMGYLTDEGLGEVLHEARERGEVLGTTLERSGRVTRSQLEAALAAQVQRLFGRLFAAPRAIFAFRQGDLGLGEAKVDLSPRHLLMESARLADELAAREAAERAAALGGTAPPASATQEQAVAWMDEAAPAQDGASGEAGSAPGDEGAEKRSDSDAA